MSNDNVEAFLHAVDDSGCRALLDAMKDDAKAVRELSEECDIPLSTAYRKIDRLQAAGLVEETVRLGGSGGHKNAYERSCEGALITITDDGEFEVELFESNRPDTHWARIR